MNSEEVSRALTAYALGELTAAERSAVEARLGADEALRQEYLLIVELCGALQEQFQTEPALKLGAWRRFKIRFAASRLWGRPLQVYALPLATAAALMLLVWGPSPEVEQGVGVATEQSESLPVTATASARAPDPELRQGLAGPDRDENQFSDRVAPPVQRRPRYSPRPAPVAPLGPGAWSGTPSQRFLDAREHPLSTFSTDVDTASYARLRQQVNQGQAPSQVRIEELINYFDYEYAKPRGRHPLAISTELTQAPWAEHHRLLRVGLRAKSTVAGSQSSNLVFLVDVSGSMDAPERLPLLKRSLRLLTRQLDARDWVSIVTYAGQSQVALKPTRGSNQRRILAAIEGLSASGSTHGSAGIREAYALAAERFVTGGINRVILATDGDFNVGVSDPDELRGLIARRAESGVFLSVLGVGGSSGGDQRLEALAHRGNGNYSFIDSEREAERVLIQELEGVLNVVAKDVKVQVEFDPEQVASYRLIGYDNRRLSAGDFHDDHKDAGDVGADQVVTALYEILPQQPARGEELLTVRVRYKEPTGGASHAVERQVAHRVVPFSNASSDTRFAAAVGALGLNLSGDSSFDTIDNTDIKRWAERALAYGPRREQRLEFVGLLDQLTENAAHGHRGGAVDCRPPWHIVDGIKKLKPGCF